MASERLSTTSLESTLQKAIPKKPPPPAPAGDPNSNGSSSAASSDQAPALPPKPNNQFNPFLQQRPLPQPTTQLRAVREQARVIYAYKPSNNDELEMEVGDIIDVIDKNTEDQGWWKGELNGKIGVFPDNFVQLIGVQEMPPVPQQQQQQQQQQQPDWHNNSRLSGSAASNHSNNTSNSGGYSHHQPPPLVSSSTEGRIKSVFAGTPKGFSKELESNLEKHSNPASFLSLKRNKLQHQQMSSGLPTDTPPASMSNPNHNPNQQLFDHHHQLPAAPSLTTSNPALISMMPSTDTSPKQNGHSSRAGPLDSSPSKLNHITANRAKGPARRPPKNILNKRFQQNELASNDDNIGNNTINQEPLEIKDESPTPASLPTFNNINNNHQSHQAVAAAQLPPPPMATGGSPPRAHVPDIRSSSVEVSPPADHQQQHQQQTNSKQMPAPTAAMVAAMAAAAGTMTATPSTGSAPPWMVELRKTNSEKKRDPPQPQLQPTTTTATVNNVVATSEITELRNEVRKLQDDFKIVHELKNAIEVMRIDLKACQSATESQRRYIKELVNNLADERKKIAAMQVEIDRNLSDQL